MKTMYFPLEMLLGKQILILLKIIRKIQIIANYRVAFKRFSIAFNCNPARQQQFIDKIQFFETVFFVLDFGRFKIATVFLASTY